MQSNQSAAELLAHFDRPKTLDLPDFEWVDDVLPREPQPGWQLRAVSPEPFDESSVKPAAPSRRGILWVLQWAAALAVLVVSAGILMDFAYLLAAENKLGIAACAGATEATLPRATHETVMATIERRLARDPALARQVQFAVLQNGTPLPRRIRQHDGDRFTVALWAPASAALPDWMRPFAFWRGESRIEVRAEQIAPGRKLPRQLAFQPAAE